VAQIISLGFVTANSNTLVANLPAPSGASLTCNKVLVQALPSSNATDYVYFGLKGLNKTTGAGVVAVLQPGQTAVIGDERDSNVIDPTGLAVDSVSGNAVITGLLYKR
jgi:hypothetical protein